MFSNSFPKERKPAQTLQEDKQYLAGQNLESADNELIKYFLPEIIQNYLVYIRVSSTTTLFNKKELIYSLFTGEVRRELKKRK